MVDNDTHLSVISGDGPPTEGGDGDPTTRQRGPSRPKPRLKLPTERMTLDKQVAALQAFVRASDRGANGVGAKEIAPRIGVSELTAGLVNNFFVEAGFIAKAGKGRYKPVPEAVHYEREASFRKPDAPKILAALLRDKWYFTAIRPELAGGRSVTPDVLINILATEAGVANERRQQLEMILEWLDYVGLIVTRDDGKIALPSDAATITSVTTVEGSETRQHETPPVDDGAKSEKSTAAGGDSPKIGPPILGFKFEFSLTADDLKKFSPDQITALYAAVGKVIAIKAEAGIE
jgi:hypothetical protein